MALTMVEGVFLFASLFELFYVDLWRPFSFKIKS